MNAVFLEKFILYRNKYRIEVAKLLIGQKIRNQFGYIKKRKESEKYILLLQNTHSIQKILLIEARAAKDYWSIFKKSLNHNQTFKRKPHASDPTNAILDIGYHFLATEIKKICLATNIPTELGFFHVAQSAHSHPFIYDCMEWLRPLVVDSVIFKKHKQSKKRLVAITQKDIGKLINAIKHSLDKLYFHRELGYCITLRYWITLFFLHFESCVNKDHVFNPLFPSLRHESRCKPSNKKPPDKLVA